MKKSDVAVRFSDPHILSISNKSSVENIHAMLSLSLDHMRKIALNLLVVKKIAVHGRVQRL